MERIEWVNQYNETHVQTAELSKQLGVFQKGSGTGGMVGGSQVKSIYTKHSDGALGKIN